MVNIYCHLNWLKRCPEIGLGGFNIIISGLAMEEFIVEEPVREWSLVGPVFKRLHLFLAALPLTLLMGVINVPLIHILP